MNGIYAYPQTNLGSASLSVIGATTTLFDTVYVIKHCVISPTSFVISALAGFCFACLANVYLNTAEKNQFFDYSSDDISQDFEEQYQVSERAKMSSVINCVMGIVPSILALSNQSFAKYIFGAEVTGFRTGFMLTHAFIHGRYMVSNINH